MFTYEHHPPVFWTQKGDLKTRVPCFKSPEKCPFLS